MHRSVFGDALRWAGPQSSQETSLRRIDGDERRVADRFDRDLIVGVDAHGRGSLETDASNLGRRQVGGFDKGSSSGVCVGPTRANRGHLVVRLDDVAVPGEHEDAVLAADEQPRLQLPEKTVSAPLASKLHGRAAAVAVVVLELAFKALEEGESVGRGAGEADQDLVV